IGTVARLRGAGNEPVQRDETMFTLHQYALVDEFGAEHVAQPLRHVAGSPMSLRLVVVKETESDIGVCHGNTLERVEAMAVFSGLGAKKLAARRNAVEQLADVYGRASGSGRGTDFPGAAVDLPGMVGIGAARG